jgi:myo-inositol-1(or 4)-monophosphatase
MEPTVNIALRAARKAGEIIVRAQQQVDLIKVDHKGHNDFVSEVDRACEKEILYHLTRAYPDHGFTGEETGQSGNADSDHQWIIDPLDGTTNFLHGIPHCAVSIACIIKGRIEHAVIYDPFRNEEFTATRGRGAMLNDRRLRVTGRKEMDGALFATGIPFNSPSFDNIDGYLGCLKELAGQSSGIRRIGAASLDLAYLAAGRFDAFWEMNLKPWDIAAGVLLVKEAGGFISDFQGSENYLKSGHIIAATPKLFKPTLQIVQKHLGHVK